MSSRVYPIIRLLRPLQWVKNGVVFAPLLFSGEFMRVGSVVQVCLIFLVFCLTASVVYVMNDLRDIESDRKHPIKQKTRPLASGEISKKQGQAILTALAVALFILLFKINFITAEIISLYILLNIFYSMKGKEIVILDIFLIAAGFMLRVFAGATMISVPVSHWMFVTMFSAALFMGSIKRLQELKYVEQSKRLVLADYSEALLERYSLISAIGALMSYSFFVAAVREELIITLPIVFFVFFRYYYLAEQKGFGESPTDLLVRDPVLAPTILVWIGISALILSGAMFH